MAESLRGKFLVAGPKLRDTNFFKTVVLLIEHAADGAMGLVVNRPSSLSVGNALAGHLELPDADEMVYVGGPVEPADLFLLHTDASVADVFDTPDAVLDGLYITNTAEQFNAVLSSQQGAVRSKVFSGYAGWGPSQLESELATGDWLIADGVVDDVFHACAYDLWDRLRETVQKSHRMFAVDAPHPEWN